MDWSALIVAFAHSRLWNLKSSNLWGSAFFGGSAFPKPVRDFRVSSWIVLSSTRTNDPQICAFGLGEGLNRETRPRFEVLLSQPVQRL